LPRSDAWVLVLAAGQGRRMGGPKALMQVAGRPWWQWQMERLAASQLRQQWVVSEFVRQSIPAGALPDYSVAQADAPMFESLIRGISAIRSRRDLSARGLFVLPVDVPAPSTQVFESLMESDEVAAPVHAGAKGHPVYLPWPWVETTLIRHAASAGPAERRLDRMIVPRFVPVDDPSVVANLNTPKDVAEWLASNRPPHST
jgi:CTP:molybdopterin cytidylyltransferase MocA